MTWKIGGILPLMILLAGCQADQGLIVAPAADPVMMRATLNMAETPGSPVYIAGSIDQNWTPDNYNARTQFGSVGNDGVSVDGSYSRRVGGWGNQYDIAFGTPTTGDHFRRLDTRVRVIDTELHHVYMSKYGTWWQCRIERDEHNAPVVDPLERNVDRLMEVTILYNGRPSNPTLPQEPIDPLQPITLESAWTAFTGLQPVAGEYDAVNSRFVWRQKFLKPAPGEADAEYVLGFWGLPTGVRVAGCYINGLELVNLEGQRFVFRLSADGTITNPFPTRDDRWVGIEVGD